MPTRPLHALLLLLACVGTGPAAPPSSPTAPGGAVATKHVLVLGNSYSAGSAPAIVELFKREARDFHFTFVTPGGFTLEKHAKTPKTRQLITSRTWDSVVLQEQSQTPGLPGRYQQSFHRAVADLTALARRSSKTRIVLFMTWGRRDGDRKNPAVYPDFTTMQTRLSTQYRLAADKHQLDIAPVGDAFALVHRRDSKLFRSLYKNDGSHPSPTAAYLAACVFHTAFTGKPADTIQWDAGLAPSTATALRQAAGDAVQDPPRQR